MLKVNLLAMSALTCCRSHLIESVAILWTALAVGVLWCGLSAAE